MEKGIKNKSVGYIRKEQEHQAGRQIKLVKDCA